MTDRLKSLSDQRASAWSKMNELRDAIGDKPASAEQRQEWDAIEADIAGLGDDIEREGRAVAFDKIAAKPVTERIDPEAPVAEDGIDEKRYAKAFTAAMRHGFGAEAPLSTEDRQILAARRLEGRAQSEGTTTAGGFLVPSGYREVITETLKAFGGLLGIADVITTSTGNPLPWPGNDDTGNLGALLSENTVVPEVDLTISQKQLSAWTYTSKLVLVSLQLLQDSAFDLDTWLPKKLGQRLGRAISADLVTGSGTSKPTGINLAPVNGVTGTAGSTTAALWSGNTYGKAYQDLVNLTHSVDQAYRQLGNCRFLMNDLTMGAIRSITDANNRPLWDPGYTGVAQSGEETILGYPVTIDNAMPVMGVSAKSILFGDFEAGYIVRNVLDPTIMRLTERYADFLQVGFFGFQRIDGMPDDAAAIRSFVNSAT